MYNNRIYALVTCVSIFSLLRLVDTGLVLELVQKQLRRLYASSVVYEMQADTLKTLSSNKLELKKLIGAFYLLGFGCFLGALAMISEICIRKLNAASIITYHDKGG